MANEFIARNGLIAQNSSTVTGSLTVTGGITGSLLGTSSYANQALSSSYALTASYALNAAAASSFPFTGSAIISGSLSVIGPTSLTGSLAVSSSVTGNVFSVSASYIDFDFDSFLFSGSTTFQGSISATNASASFGNASITGSLFGTSSWAVSSSRAVTSSFALTASFALNAAAGSGFPFTGSAIITGSLTTIGRNTLTGSFTASNSESIDLLNSIIFHPTTTGSKVYQSTISPIFRTTAPNQTSTALRVNPTFTGSFSSSNAQNLIVDFGATNVGSQFTVNDITSGSIYMVNDISGLPIIEATSDWSVNIYDYPNIVLRKTGSLVQISGSLVVTGGGITGSLFGTSSWSQNARTASYFNGNVTSASYAETASFAPAYLPLTGGTINGNVTVNGTASVAYLNVTYESASVIYSSGSNQFGDSVSDTQILIGTILVSGSTQITGSLNVTGSNIYLRTNTFQVENIDINGSLIEATTGAGVNIWSTDTNLSADFETRTTKDASSYNSIDWQSRKLYYTDGATTIIDWFNNFANDRNGNVSINWGDGVRQLYDNTATASVDWNNRALKWTDGTTTIVDWQAAQAYDRVGVLAIEWSDSKRTLYKSDGTTVSVDWEYAVLNDASALTSLDWASRSLIATDGSSISIDWGAYNTNDSSGNPSIDYDRRWLILGASNVLKWDTLQLYSTSSAALSLDWNNRQLIKSDGTTVAFDWENGQMTGSLNVTGSQVYLTTDEFKLKKADGTDIILMDGSGAVTVYGVSGEVAADITNRQLYDTNTSGSINWENRHLLKSDGTTVSVDWENGILTGSLHGTASWAENALTASYVNGIITKANEVVGGTFGGTPLTASVTFASAFPNTNYSVTITGENARIFTIQNKSAGSFEINSNSSVALSGNVYWQAVSYGEFNG